ncbi:uncharacterized protein BP5553_00847 [Venustampulla echinocandica]|uniref:Uncharacterized protein n=1 Tax=Venustampulla echinocandica TaxID=2656787 RepID=A0A370TZF1_9HELO|nr:uncharacterized protein BP5553_00847 [Venustampulla echinocandica]RDL40868.1 hypothetical protein BP5553_00847 [Venustampulla echinocandica]
MLPNKRENKPRLTLALYSRPKHPGTYHYALFVVPKSRFQDPATKTKNNIFSSLNSKSLPSPNIFKFHVKNTLMVEDGQVSSPWRFEGVDIDDLAKEGRLLVLVVVGKVLCGLDEAEKVMRERVGVYQTWEGEEGKEFNCVTWVRDALSVLRKEGLINGMEGGWGEMKQSAEEFVERKRKERRWDGGWTGREGVPYWGLMRGEEGVVL